MTNSDILAYQLLTTRYLRKQAKNLAGQLAGVREGSDIECVHQARVACRRLHAVLQMSRDCIPKKQFKVWRKEIRKLLKGLGEARDRDVQIAFLWSFLADLNDRALLPGIARIAVGLEHQREQLQPTVVAAVERAEYSGVLKAILSTSKEILGELEREKVQLVGEDLFARLEHHVSGNLDEFIDRQDSLEDAQNEQGHHEMRIAAKHLRYTMEIGKPAYAGQFDGYVVSVKRVQSLLGDIHDCDVWVEHLAATLGEEGKRLAEHYGHSGALNRLAAGIEYLRDERRSARARLFQELVDYWCKLKQEGYWENLRGLVGSCALQGGVPLPEDDADSAEGDEETDGAGSREPFGTDHQRPALEAAAGDWT